MSYKSNCSLAFVTTAKPPTFFPAEGTYLQQRDLSTGACWNPGHVMSCYTTQWDQSIMAAWDARFISHSNIGLGIVSGRLMLLSFLSVWEEKGELCSNGWDMHHLMWLILEETFIIYKSVHTRTWMNSWNQEWWIYLIVS